MLVKVFELYDGDRLFDGKSLLLEPLRPKYIEPTNSDTSPFFTLNDLLSS